MVSFRKIKYTVLDNFSAVRKIARFGKRMQKELRSPRLVSIELTNACNADCIMCSRKYMKRKVRHMPLRLAEHVIDECKKAKVRGINLFWMGESLMHPHLDDILQYAKRVIPNIPIGLNTNGSLLTDERATIILNSTIGGISVSVDGCTKETYEAIRKNLSYDQVRNNVENFIHKRNSMGMKTPSVGAYFIQMEENAMEAKLFEEHWSAIADGAKTVAHWNWGGTQKNRAVGDHRKRASAQTFNFPCMNLWKELVISNDGTVSMCCVDYDITEEIGNIETSSIMQIWRGPALQRIRKLHMEKKYKEIGMCAACNRFALQMNSSWEHMWVES